ncbi:MAG: hypothetical protein ABIV06_01310 [Thermoanaerobaculia bacterium]
MRRSGVRPRRFLAAAVLLFQFASAAFAEERQPEPSTDAPAAAEPENLVCRPAPGRLQGLAQAPSGTAVIGEILVRNDDVFDPTLPAENRWLFRIANRLHWTTRVPAICSELLFAPGDPYDPQQLAESERLLRGKRYLHDAGVQPIAVHEVPGGAQRVDVGVTTRDVWTLALGVGVGRSGGSNETHFSLRDSNIFGTGRYLSLARDTNVDRTETALAFLDANLLGRHGRLDVQWSDNSDGHERQLELARPFYALDSRWGVGGNVHDLARVDHRYSLGHAFDAFALQRREAEVWGGWSNGLSDAGRATRYRIGLTWSEDRFQAVEGTHEPLPDSQDLIYPWVSVELAEEAFRQEQNLDQIGRTEDVFLGHRATLRLGFTSGELGGLSNSNRPSTFILIADADGGRDLSDRTTLLYSIAASARFTGAGSENVRLGASARLLRRNFGEHLLVASLAYDFARDLDAGEQLLLGGDNGLRGYPLRYQDGTSRLLFTVEQRYFTGWYPFQLAHIGFAGFADVGRTFGEPAVPGSDLGWLEDIGVGLRLAPSRSGLGAVIHLDVALPLAGDSSIQSVQWLVRTRASF